MSGNAYWANSGGLVHGQDMGPLLPGGRLPAATCTFRFWTGDDTDASVVIDDRGCSTSPPSTGGAAGRSAEVSQIMKLDPTKPDNPLVWSIPDMGANPAGVWATPAIHGGMLPRADQRRPPHRRGHAVPARSWESRSPAQHSGSRPSWWMTS